MSKCALEEKEPLHLVLQKLDIYMSKIDKIFSSLTLQKKVVNSKCSEDQKLLYQNISVYRHKLGLAKRDFSSLRIH